jgi:hypothetical protein
MYDLLLKWDLESLSKATIAKSDQEVAVMLEAIKAKNNLVVERFRYSWDTSQAIISLALEIEESLLEFKENTLQLRCNE